ncbi:translocation/assembly module TamB domain-containing protein [uncultured Hydrogenophaga sp.]|uniref:translocation/assembly module TamB domain-containing protein n=1 Tax=uncultured Hydrogenophaga sp. TaxID=199683 RepID=UPI00258A8DED|nr:translocation/assembly module TamB domain-containing protein [uncultured Hydrogenophaga sp.]
MDEPTPAPAPLPPPVAPPPARRWPGLTGGIGRALMWIFGPLAGALLAGGLLLGAWAASEGSLSQALSWGVAWQAENAPEAGELSVDGVEGSLIGGGRLRTLTWDQSGLAVQAEGVRLTLGGLFWLGLLRGDLLVSELHADRLRIIDQRPPTPTSPGEPLQSLVLPVDIEATVSVDELLLPGQEPLALRGLQARYRYGRAEPGLGTEDAHTLLLRSLQWAEGRYTAQATLGAQDPMPLRLQAEGELSAEVPEGGRLNLRARATAQGQLAGADAALDLVAQIEPVGRAEATPTLAGTARLRPWAPQPLAEADLRLFRLNLALLWPQAPTTALTGTAQARPDGTEWRARLALNNESPGPVDKRRLPLESIEAEVLQSGERWTLERLSAAVAGGRVQAEGRRDPPAPGAASALGDWQGSLRASGLNPALAWSALAPAALDARVDARAVDPNAARPAIDIDARVAPAGRQPRRSAAEAWRLREVLLQGRWQPGDTPGHGLFTVRKAHIDALDGLVDAKGRVDTARPLIEGEASVALPGLRARWNGLLAQAQGQGDLDLALADGERLLAWLRALADAPVLGGFVKPALAPLIDWRAEGQAQARLRWQGGLATFGFPGPQARAAAPRLNLALGTERLQLERTGESPLKLGLGSTRLSVQGPPEALAVALRTRVESSGWRAELDTAGELGFIGQPLDARRGQLALNRLSLSATPSGKANGNGNGNGTGNTTTGENGAAVSWAMSSQSPLRARWQPRGDAIDAELDGASLQVQPRRAGGAALAPVNITWDQLIWRSGALQTRGRIDGLPLAWADALTISETRPTGALAEAGLGGDLVFDGRWDLSLPAQASEPPRLSAQLQRRGGDLAVQTLGAFDDPRANAYRVQAGVKTAELELRTEGRRVAASLRWDSERFGTASADFTSELGPPDATHGAWHWPEYAPLSGRVRASLPEVGVWSVLAPPGWRVRGALNAEVNVAGTRAAPQLSGLLEAKDLALRSLVDGIVFRGGELRATLAGERIVIDRFYLEGRGGAERGGVLQGTGSAEWRRVQRDGATVREPVIAIDVSADKLRASSRPDRRVTVSGQVRARLEGAALQLRGNLRADEALIVLPDEAAPSLGDDVVVRGTEYPIDRRGGVPVIPDVRITVDLGPSFELRGQGLQTRLEGQLEIRTNPPDPAPRVVGEVRTVRGTYRAYGQQLAIETGVLRFNGAYDNPALEIDAVRPNTTQRVGVQITGTAQAPRVRLFSDPEMPDSEKLAWLVLGRPASGAGAEAAVLQQAALALLAGSDGGPLDGGLAQALGLDTLSFTGTSSSSTGNGTESSAAVMLGKQIADNLYLSYERSLAGTLSTVSMFYDVSRRVTVRARAGSENAIDLIFTLRYD